MILRPVRIACLLGGSVFVFVFSACSGASSSDLFGPPLVTASSETEPAPSTDESDAPGGESSSSTDSGVPSKNGGDGQKDSGTGEESKDNGTDAGKDAGAPTGPVIHCGQGSSSQLCSVNQEICCVSLDPNSSHIASYACEEDSSLACANGIPVECDDTSDCPAAQFCCGTLGSNSRYESVFCSPTCDSETNLTRVQFCDPKLSVSDCPTGTLCVQSISMPGFSVCQPKPAQ